MLKRDEYIKKIVPFIDKDVIKVLTGIRRSGKSVMLKLLMEELKNIGINEKQFIYINFENLKYRNLKNYERLYDFILNKIIDEEILFIAKKDNNYIVNGSYDAVEYLEVFKNIYFEEVELDSFYSYVLSKKENQDKKVLVGYNGIDGKEVTMSKFKEDINEIRDSRNIFKN